jgi:hypothetical protein
MRAPTRPYSRWQAQLEVTGLATPPADAPIDAVRGAERERAALAAYALSPLVLRENVAPRRHPPEARRLRLWSGLACAAAIAFSVWRHGVPQGGTPRWTMKGGEHVEVFWERDGRVQPLAPGRSLAAGDRVRAQVTAAQASVAFALVVDARGAPLVDAAFVAAHRVEVGAGESAPLPGSIELDAQAAGESLVVVVCEVPEGATAGGATTDGATTDGATMPEAAELLDGWPRLPKTCRALPTKLR